MFVRVYVLVYVLLDMIICVLRSFIYCFFFLIIFNRNFFLSLSFDGTESISASSSSSAVLPWLHLELQLQLHLPLLSASRYSSLCLLCNGKQRKTITDFYTFWNGFLLVCVRAMCRYAMVSASAHVIYA